MKKTKVTVLILVSFIAIISTFWLYVLPTIISNNKFINFICSKVSETTPYVLKINSLNIKTYLTPKISCSVDSLILLKQDNKLLDIEDLSSEIFIKNIFKQRIVLNKLDLKYLFANLDLFDTSTEETTTPNNWQIDFVNSNIKLDKAKLIYSPSENSKLEVNINKVFLDNTNSREPHLRFILQTVLTQGLDSINFEIADQNKVYIKDKHLLVDDCVFKINKSQIHIKADLDEKGKFNLNVLSSSFKIEDVAKIIKTNLIIANGKEVLSYFKDLKGNFNFNFLITDKDIQGNINLLSSSAILIPINNLPLQMNKGSVKITKKDIYLTDFEGFWGTNSADKVFIEGTVKDYTKTCDTIVSIKSEIDTHFAKNYLSQVAGIPLDIIGQAKTQVIVKSILDKIDIIVMSKLAKGDDLLVDGASLTPTNYDRALKADLHIYNGNLNIEKINYYIASELKRGVKVQPVVTLAGNVDISKTVPVLKDLGFEIPRALPSEFLNVLIGQKLFKGGTFSGKLYVINADKIPSVSGKIVSENIRIPSQRLKLNKAELYTTNNLVHILANGKYKRSNFTFDGDIKNEIKYPIVIKNMDFTLDKLDVEKLLNSITQTPQVNLEDNNDNENDNSVTFDFANLIIENSSFKLKSGSYKDIQFGNLNTNLTLDKNSVLKLESNKFDIAEGISTIKVNCDLKKEKYYLRLGVKDVNSDLISTTLLNLPREISGKAMGLIELNSDSSFKMNGIMRFAITDGQIQKIGLVKYLMNLASLFRNPVAMITPSTIMDVVNIPSGDFEKINGELHIKDNNVHLLKIKSSSKLLGCYIIGSYNIEKSDAILRIYTKFSNKNSGTFGFLRKISLNSLANRIPFGGKNDANYYAAEIKNIPSIDADEKDCQIFLTTVDGDLEHNNFLSSLKKIK
jgi:hypothetical protein